MGIHRPTDRHFFTIGGSVMKKGSSLNLSKGQFGVFDITKATKEGLKAVESFKGKPKDTLYEMKLGVSDQPISRSMTNKPWSTFPFKIENVLDVNVSAPKMTEQKVDEVIIGYDGLEESKSFNFEKGDVKKIVMRLEGEAIGWFGYENAWVDVPILLDTENCSPYEKECEDCNECVGVDCKAVVLKAIEGARNFPLLGADRTVSDIVEITPVFSCDDTPSVTEEDYDFWCLDVCDTGDSNALSLVQAQYPDVKIERVDRKGSQSFYQFLQPASADAPQDFEVTFESLLKGCKECPEGYTEVEGGLVYSVSLEDDGQDMTSVVQGLTNAVADTAIKTEGQDFGVGTYTVVLSEKLSDEDLEAFVQSEPTAVVQFVAKSADWCDNDSTVTESWSKCGTCKVSEEKYRIQLPDNECGEGRLEELQEAFPYLTITVAEDEEGNPIEGGCQAVYETTVKTNMVCDECDPVFKDYYTSEAPSSYDGVKWKKVGVANNETNCLCGIRIKSKIFEVHPSECLLDEFGFLDSSVRIQVSGNFQEEFFIGIDETYAEPYDVTWLSKAVKRTHLGGHLRKYEKESETFFTGKFNNNRSLAEQYLTGTESHIEVSKQYVDYAVTVKRDFYSQSFGQKSEDIITYHVYAEVGRHKDVEDVINMIASASGLPAVKA